MGRLRCAHTTREAATSSAPRPVARIIETRDIAARSGRPRGPAAGRNDFERRTSQPAHKLLEPWRERFVANVIRAPQCPAKHQGHGIATWDARSELFHVVAFRMAPPRTALMWRTERGRQSFLLR